MATTQTPPSGALAPPPDHTSPKAKRSWVGYVVIGIVGIVIGAAGAGGNDTSKSVADAPVSPAHVAVQNSAPSDAPTAAAATPAAGWKTKHISGDGNEIIGTLHVPTDGVLRWHQANKDNFVMNNDFNDDESLAANSIARSGKTVVLAGNYHKVEVIAGDHWSLTISPK